jgi:hypothetical protein
VAAQAWRCPEWAAWCLWELEVTPTLDVVPAFFLECQLIVFCSPAMNRSREFASRPGACLTTGPEPSTSLCTWDTDCPGLQKCCPWSGGHHCVAPAPQGKATTRMVSGRPGLRGRCRKGRCLEAAAPIALGAQKGAGWGAAFPQIWSLHLWDS